MEMNGKFEGFPRKLCIVWVGVSYDPCPVVWKGVLNGFDKTGF